MLDRSIAASEPVQRVVDQVVALLPELVEEFAANAQRQRDDVDLLAATAHALAKGEPLPEPPAPDNGVQAPPLADAPQAAAEAQSDVELLDPQLLEIFTNEAETHLEALVGFLADCARELPQPVTDALQRALHTLKGSAHMAGILPIAEIATPLEKLVKEYKSNLLAFDLREAELLHDAEQLFRIGLEQVGAHRPLNPIPGSDALLERIEALHQERIASLEAERYSDAGERRDPLLIEAFLVEGMDILLDAEDLLERWHEHPQERQELSALREELSALDQGARHAELPQVEELCQALLALYDAVEEGRLAVSPAFFEEARQAHEALIGMMDQVAAGLQVTPRPERVAALQELLEAPAAEAVPFIDPESLGADDFPGRRRAGPPRGGLRRGRDACRGDRTGSACTGSRPRAGRGNGVDLPRRGGGHPRKRRPGTGPMAGRAGALSSLSALQRDLHTLKGGARMAEIAEIGDLAHELEALYEGLVDRRYQHSPQLAGLLQACHDRLAEQLDQLSAGQPWPTRTTLSRRSAGSARARWPRLRHRARRKAPSRNSLHLPSRSPPRLPRRSRPLRRRSKSAIPNWWRSSSRKASISSTALPPRCSAGSTTSTTPSNWKPCSATCIPSRAVRGWPRSARSATSPMSLNSSTKASAADACAPARPCSTCCSAATTSWPRCSRRCVATARCPTGRR